MVQAGAFIAAMRPLHWAKNLLVFVPVISAHRLDQAALLPALGAFVALSLAASAIYLLNDLADLDADRAHPRKRFRAIASGALPVPAARAGAAVLAALGAAVGVLAGVGLAVIGYLGAAALYSLRIKRVRWADMVLLSGLHVGRVFAGGLAAGIAVSGWLAGFSFLVFLALAALKREAELRDLARRGAARVPGRGYRAGDLGAISARALGAAAASVAVLALYVASPQVTGLYARPGLMWLLCPVMALWLGWLVRETRAGRMGDDPLVFALTDPLSIGCGLALPLIMFVAV